MTTPNSDHDDRHPPPEPPPAPLTASRWEVPESRAAVLARALSMEGRKIRYVLGAGKILVPWRTPRAGDPMDCSEFVCWCLGIEKLTKEPFYRKLNGGWINSSAIVYDGTHAGGLFTEVKTPLPGDVIVFGWRNGAAGHVGLVLEVHNGAVKTVIDCSSYHYRRTGDAIGRRPPDVWKARGGIVVRPDWL